MRSKGCKKAVFMVLTSVVMLTGTIADAVLAKEAGWRENAVGWWYQNPDGSYQKNGWFQDIDKNWYYFDSDGYMQTGWIWDRGDWYFTDESGKMQTGVLQINGQVYYFNPVFGDDLGKMQTGKVVIKNQNYYFNANGNAVGDVPSAERSYQLPSQTAYKKENPSVESSRVNETNRDQMIPFKSQALEEMLRTFLGVGKEHPIVWNDVKGYTTASFEILTDSRGKLIFEVELKIAENSVGTIQIGLEELENVVEDLSYFPDLKAVELKGIYMRSFLSSNRNDEQNITDMEMLIEALAKHISMDEMLMKIDLELSVNTD